jgi:hypothetical protein
VSSRPSSALRQAEGKAETLIDGYTNHSLGLVPLALEIIHYACEPYVITSGTHRKIMSLDQMSVAEHASNRKAFDVSEINQYLFTWPA